MATDQNEVNASIGESPSTPWLYLGAVLACTAVWVVIVRDLDSSRTWLRLSRWLPTAIALAFLLTSGRAAVRAAFVGFTVRKQQWVWLFLSAVLFAALAMIASSANFILFHPETPMSLNPIPMNVVLMLMVWSLGEEFGWRGYALPRVVDRVGPCWASFIVGMVWWLWHTPGWLVGFGAPTDISYLIFGVWVVSASYVFTFFYLRSGRNVWTAVLMHAGANTAFAVVPVMPFNAGGNQAFFMLVGLCICAAIIVSVLMRSQRF